MSYTVCAPVVHEAVNNGLDMNLCVLLLFCRYFSLQATQPLGMGDGVRVEIESRICDERGPRPDSYLPAQLLAYDTMNEA